MTDEERLASDLAKVQHEIKEQVTKLFELRHRVIAMCRAASEEAKGLALVNSTSPETREADARLFRCEDLKTRVNGLVDRTIESLPKDTTE